MGLFETDGIKIMRHPAKYSDPLLPIFKDLVDESNKKMILDPFGGTGKLKDVFPNAIIYYSDNIV